MFVSMLIRLRACECERDKRCDERDKRCHECERDKRCDECERDTRCDERDERCHKGIELHHFLCVYVCLSHAQLPAALSEIAFVRACVRECERDCAI